MRADRSPRTQPLPMTMGCDRQEHTAREQGGWEAADRWCSTLLPFAHTSTPGATSVPSPTDNRSGSGQCLPSQHTFLPTRIPKLRSTPLYSGVPLIGSHAALTENMTTSFSSLTRSRKGPEATAVAGSKLDKNEPTNAIFHRSAATTHHTIASHGTSHSKSQQDVSSVPLRVGTPFWYVSDGVVVTQSITGSIATNGETITAFTSIAPRTGSPAAAAAESFTSPSTLVLLSMRFSRRSGLPHQMPFCNDSASEATARLPKTALGPTELPGCNTAPLATKELDLRAMLRKRGPDGVSCLLHSTRDPPL
eukprot:scaffold4051_cov68-Phaeocystis_antarctica.AAC.4